MLKFKKKIFMKIFPTKNYKIELTENPEKYIELLKLKTFEKETLSTTLTNKEFIGRINENHFEIIGSEAGIGAFTVLKGDFLDDSVSVVAEINKPFKILIAILFVFGLVGISFNVFKIGFPKAFGMLIPLIMLIGLLRFVFLGFFFKLSLNLIFRKFTSLLNITPNNSNF